jgi:glutamine amidotransferase
MRTALIDYDSGNLHSAQKAFVRMAEEVGGGEVIVTSDPRDVLRADRVVLPGDGAFPACHTALSSYNGLFDAISEVAITRARPFLGICVGMQMLATWGREFENTRGFDWIGGEVTRIAPADHALKIPHMGWNDLVITAQHPVLAGLKTGDHAYFVHSYAFTVDDPTHRLAYADYGQPITAIVACDNIIGTQFHPEKSQRLGLRMIGNFLRWGP